MMRLRLAFPMLCAGAGILSATASAAAQDAHYWTFQYGPRSSLLGGAVIGSVDDVSGTFYNPGAISRASDLAFAVSTNVFEYSGVRLEDGGGEGIDLGTAKSGLRPSLIAGTLARNLFDGAGILAYSALTRSRGTQDLAGAAVLSADQIPPDRELNDLVGLVDFTGNFSDVWAGLTYSHALGENLGVGVTWYGAARSQKRKREAVSQFVRTDGTGLSSVDIAAGEYSTLRTLLKFGAYFQLGPVTGGATLTTASLHVTGSGQLVLNRSLIGSDTTALAAAVQTDLPAEYRSPLSIGGGLAWSVGRARFHGSLEWFDRIDPYTVIQGDSVVAQAPETERGVLDAVQEQTDALNWALGLEYSFTTDFSAYLSYFTDRSTVDESTERASLSIVPIDISTVTLGADFPVGPARFTLGAGYGWGSEVDRELTDLLRQDDETLEAAYVYRSIKLLFGFAIGVG